MRSKLSVAFLMLLLFAALFAVDNKTASACSLASLDYALDFHDKYKLVLLNEYSHYTSLSELRKQYSKPGLYDMQTNKLLWQPDPRTFPFPVDTKIYITSDGTYMIKVDLTFFPRGLYFYKEGVLLNHYPLSFFDIAPYSGRDRCTTGWIRFEMLQEGAGKFYLETTNYKEYVFSIFTGEHLQTIDNNSPSKRQSALPEFLTSPIFIIGSLLFLIFILYVIDIRHLLRVWISRCKQP